MDRVVFSHLSDFHLGNRLMDNRFFPIRPLSGYNTHDDRLFDALQDALDYARIELIRAAADEPFPIVFSGDLTATGTNNDFALAHAVLFQHWCWKPAPRARHAGFNWRREDVFLIPGNHDHWRNRWFQMAYSEETNQVFFKPTPWRIAFRSRKGTFELELFFVDSNSGLLGESWNLMARGRISDEEFVTLDRLLQHSVLQTTRREHPPIIRAFVCHHAFANPDGSTDGCLELESRNLLHFLAARYRVPIILTGHTHRFNDKPWTNVRLLAELSSTLQRFRWRVSADFDPSWPLYEQCCTATLAGPYRSGRQGFYVHQLAAAGKTGLEWRTWRFLTAACDFIPESVQGEQVFSITLR